MKKVLTLLFAVLCFSVNGQKVYTSSGRPLGSKPQQRKEAPVKGFDPSRLVVGGTFGFGMGTGSLAFSIAPVIGYRLTPKLAAGVGFGYQYFQQKDYFVITNYNTNEVFYRDYKASMISGSVWARYLILEQLFVHAEYEHNFFNYRDYNYNYITNNIESHKVSLNVPSLLLGAGYRQPMSENASVYIMAFYDVLQRDYSPYRGGIQLRIGFTVGL